MEIQTGLEYLHRHGGPDGVKAIAFAKVNHTNLAEVEAAVAIFGGLWLGITVLDALTGGELELRATTSA